ncbi:DUF5677 domain-containing protein [Allobranchiibius huperziae]|uniref:Uncharacterized protein n=1 Tax=Allobranchiibius huperziae TaxID=1874116 RepID=A0A853DNH8_9MICO|nr:DUF5677 domain-containing protein [Allobranchiibius huperziae]NYJ76554.1 hypothetical protein [Allobranchiibius huperziae]
MRLNRRRRETQSFDETFYDTVAEGLHGLVNDGMHVDEAMALATRAIDPVLDEAAPVLKRTLIRNAPKMLRERRRLHRAFRKQLRKHWGPALDLFYVLTVCAEEAGADFYSGRVAGRDSDLRALHEALTGLHARACRTALEVHELLSSGLASGALARARTMHELAVTALILQKYSRLDGHADLAERFLAHDDVQNWSDAQTYQSDAGVLSVEPFTDAEMADMKTRHEAAVAKFGQAFTGRNGWAAGLNGMKQPTFRDLERIAKLSHLRGYYRWASHEVHSGSKGSRLNVHHRGGRSVKSSGYTNAGLAAPGQMALISLHQTTVAVLLSADPISPQDLLVLKAMQSTLDDSCKAFVAGARSVQRAEERYQDAATDRSWSRRLRGGRAAAASGPSDDE